MTFFIGCPDAPVIAMDHCRETGQKFSMTPLNDDPRNDDPNMEYVEWHELNPNYIGHLGPQDKILYQDSMDVFWYIRFYPEERDVDRSGLEAVMDMMG